jgi:hypothetical protein
MHYLSICSCVKFDREHELLQWYKYHLATGVEHFYLVDDFSSIDIKSLMEEKHLTLTSSRVFVPEKKEKDHQCSIQRKMVNELGALRGKSKWVSYTDSDEFLFTKEKTFSDYLRTMEEHEGVELKHRKFFCQGHRVAQKGRIFIEFLDKYKKTYITKCVVNNEKYKRIELHPPFPCSVHRITPNSVDALGNRPYRPVEAGKYSPYGESHHCPPDPKDQPAWTQHYPIRDLEQVAAKQKRASAQHRKSEYVLRQAWSCFAGPFDEVEHFSFREEHPYVYEKFMKLYH